MHEMTPWKNRVHAVPVYLVINRWSCSGSPMARVMDSLSCRRNISSMSPPHLGPPPVPIINPEFSSSLAFPCQLPRPCNSTGPYFPWRKLGPHLVTPDSGPSAPTGSFSPEARLSSRRGDRMTFCSGPPSLKFTLWLTADLTRAFALSIGRRRPALTDSIALGFSLPCPVLMVIRSVRSTSHPVSLHGSPESDFCL